MKTVITAAVLFLVGTVLGFAIATRMVRWFISPEGIQVVSLHLDGWFPHYVSFSIGCGLLFGISPILAAWAHPKLGRVARTLSYLLGGCMISAAVALYHRWLFASLPLTGIPDSPTLISGDAIPMLRLPLTSIVLMAGVAALVKALRNSRPSNRYI